MVYREELGTLARSSNQRGSPVLRKQVSRLKEKKREQDSGQAFDYRDGEYDYTTLYRLLVKLKGFQSKKKKKNPRTHPSAYGRQ